MKVATGNHLWLFVVLFLVFFLFVGVAYAANISFQRWSISAGGEVLEGSGFVLQSGIGEPIAGIVSDDQYSLCSGLMCGGSSYSYSYSYSIYLPVAVR